jgi:hypothetical protein
VEVKSDPYLKIKKNINSQFKDMEDLHVNVTNLENMTSFFIKVSLGSHCLREEPMKLDVNTKVQMELDYINQNKSKEFIEKRTKEMNSSKLTRIMDLPGFSIEWEEKTNKTHSTAFYESLFKKPNNQ